MRVVPVPCRVRPVFERRPIHSCVSADLDLLPHIARTSSRCALQDDNYIYLIIDETVSSSERLSPRK